MPIPRHPWHHSNASTIRVVANHCLSLKLQALICCCSVPSPKVLALYYTRCWSPRAVCSNTNSYVLNCAHTLALSAQYLEVAHTHIPRPFPISHHNQQSSIIRQACGFSWWCMCAASVNVYAHTETMYWPKNGTKKRCKKRLKLKTPKVINYNSKINDYWFFCSH